MFTVKQSTLDELERFRLQDEERDRMERERPYSKEVQDVMLRLAATAIVLIVEGQTVDGLIDMWRETAMEIVKGGER